MYKYITLRSTHGKAYNQAAALKPFDAIIVPGIPFKKGAWDGIMKHRVLWSYILYQQGFTKNIIYSGAAVHTPYTEAVIMGTYACALGLPAECIHHETMARHSTENVYYSYLLAKKNGYKSLALATDPIQSYMLRHFTKKRCGTQVFHLPLVLDLLQAHLHITPDIDPEIARVADFTPLTHQQSFSRRMRGTMGRDIDWSKHKNQKLEPL
jgi:uncharacterized SAM-binding protein YcdF (DUF218 family)